MITAENQDIIFLRLEPTPKILLLTRTMTSIPFPLFYIKGHGRAVIAPI
jgi:hypothetical protein